MTWRRHVLTPCFESLRRLPVIAARLSPVVQISLVSPDEPTTAGQPIHGQTPVSFPHLSGSNRHTEITGYLLPGAEHSFLLIFHPAPLVSAQSVQEAGQSAEASEPFWSLPDLTP